MISHRLVALPRIPAFLATGMTYLGTAEKAPAKRLRWAIVDMILKKGYVYNTLLQNRLVIICK